MKNRIIGFILSVAVILSAFPIFEMTVFAETNVTRAEWISMLAETFEMTIEDESTAPDSYFSDITSDMDCYEDILLATEFGVIDLDAGEAFEPNEAATREFAAQTLNYCLRFQVDENSEYAYSEADDVNYPDDIQIAVNRGWFELSGDDFLPEQAVTLSEAEAMLDDAENVLQAEYVDEAYESSYTFDDGIKEIPEYEDVTISSDYVVTVTDYECDIEEDDIFIAYSAGIPVALKALSVTAEDNVTTIEATTDGAEGAVTEVDIEGVAEFELENFETNDVETYSVTDMETNETDEMEIKLRSISYDKSSKKLTATKDIKIDGSIGGSITVEVSDLKLYHKENTSTGDYMAYIEGNTSVTKSISFDLGNYVGIPSSITLGKINIGGVGSVSLEIGISIKGGMSSNETGVIKAGYSHTRNDGFRIIKGYKKTAYSFTAEADINIGLTLSAQIDLVVVKGKIWATIGVQGYYKFKDYSDVDGERPLQCKTIGGYLYANVGVSATINYIVDKKTWSKTVDIFTESNSPIRTYYHYEDDKLVSACTRGIEANNTYMSYTTDVDSSYFNPSPGYGQSAYTAKDGTTTTLWTYTVDDDGNATIKEYKGSSSSVAVPSKIDGYKVTKIGPAAFEHKTVKNITISDGVTYIGSEAFRYCTNLRTVKLPETLEGIGPWAFEECWSLESISLPETLETIEGRAFSGCKNLRNIKLPKMLKEIDGEVFVGCQYLTAINIPAKMRFAGVRYDDSNKRYNGPFARSYIKNFEFDEGITSIVASLFRGCEGLNSITIPESVKSIENNVFQDCDNLTKVNITNLKSWCEIDFGNAYSNPLIYAYYLYLDDELVTKVNIPSGLEKIKPYTFLGCGSIKSVTIPESVEHIGVSAFESCDSLVRITIPDKVKSIGADAFASCDRLVSVTLPNGVTEIGNSAFNGCPKLTEIILPNSVESIGSFAFSGCKGLKRITIPDNVKEIKGKTFYNCSGLETLTIPESVTSFGIDVIEGCSKLSTVGYSGTDAQWNEISGAYEFNGKEITAVCYVTFIDENENIDYVVKNQNETLSESDMEDCMIEAIYTDSGMKRKFNLATPIEENMTLFVKKSVDEEDGGNDEKHIPGDVNGDGEVTTLDVTVLRRYIAGGYGVELK